MAAASPDATARPPARRVRLDLLVACGATLATLAVAADVAGLVSIVRFTRERIEITVRPGEVAVDGTYVYRNPLPVPWTRGLAVPFPVDAGQGAPATIDACAVDAGGGECALDVRWVLGTPLLTVHVPPLAEATVRVRFTQRARGAATYLLTTTAPWGRPLERGIYVLHEDGARVVSSNYPLGADLSFAREGFLPEDDWRFSWRPEETP